MTTLSALYQPPAFELPEILYFDEHVLLVNKPAGLLSVPGRGDEKKDCLITRVQLNHPDALVVHRLDMQTSGIMLMARSKFVHTELSRQFEQREVRKVYIAIVDGVLKQARGKIELPLITDWPNRPKQKVDFKQGKPSLTHYEVMDYDTTLEASRLKLVPVTGRSHQLRVHLMTIGHVILGDMLYANEYLAAKSNRMLLHASKITFIHPVTKELMDIECKVPF